MSSAITREVAVEHLNTWLEAEEVVATGQSYSIGSRNLTRADLSDIRQEIEYWNDKVSEIDMIAKNKGRNKVRRAVPRDL